MRLSELAIGREAVITRVGGEGALRLRLLDMGMITRTRVRIEKIAPLGDPLVIHLRGYALTIRADDAKDIEVDAI